MDTKVGFRRVGVTIAACSVLFAGISATAAQAADATDKPKEHGSIEVCKKVTGSDYDDFKKEFFKFVIHDKYDEEKYGFKLKHKDCKTYKHLDDGKYRIVEKDIPGKCKVHIDVKGDKYHSFPKKGVVVVYLEKRKNEVKVTYTNDCGKKKV